MNFLAASAIALRFGFVLPLRSRSMITLTGALTGLKCETSCLTPSSLTTKSSIFRSVNGCPALSTALTFRLTRRVSMRIAPGHGPTEGLRDGGKEGGRDGETEGRRDGSSDCPSVARSLPDGAGCDESTLDGLPDGLPEELDALRGGRVDAIAPRLSPRIDLPSETPIIFGFSRNLAAASG